MSKTPSTEFDEQIRQLEAAFIQMSHKINELYQKRALVLCPFRVGDIVIDDLKDKYQVTAIITGRYASVSEWDRGYEVLGGKIRKDGSVGVERQLWRDLTKAE